MTRLLPPSIVICVVFGSGLSQEWSDGMCVCVCVCVGGGGGGKIDPLLSDKGTIVTWERKA